LATLHQICYFTCSFQCCYNAAYAKLEPVAVGGVPMEHLISCRNQESHTRWGGNAELSWQRSQRWVNYWYFQQMKTQKLLQDNCLRFIMYGARGELSGIVCSYYDHVC